VFVLTTESKAAAAVRIGAGTALRERVCAVTAARLRHRTGTQAPPAEPGMIPLTIPETARLIAALTTRPLPPGHVIHWDAWTLRHQARARWFHQRARLKRDYTLVS